MPLPLLLILLLLPLLHNFLSASVVVVVVVVVVFVVVEFRANWKLLAKGPMATKLLAIFHAVALILLVVKWCSGSIFAP